MNTKETTPPGSLQPMVRAHRGARCGFCYWALYEGEWCQNKACEWSGKEPPEKIKLSNEEAATLIKSKQQSEVTCVFQHPAINATWWVNLYPNGLITSDLCRSKEQALNKCTYTGETPDAEQVEVRLVPFVGQKCKACHGKKWVKSAVGEIRCQFCFV